MSLAPGNISLHPPINNKMVTKHTNSFTRSTRVTRLSNTMISSYALSTWSFVVCNEI